jgi:hypothetical protein
MIQRAYDALERGEFLQEFIPVPEQLKIVAGMVSDPDAQKKWKRTLLATWKSWATATGMTIAWVSGEPNGM